MGSSGCFLTQLSLRQAGCIVSWSVIWVHRISPGTSQSSYSWFAVNFKTGVSEIPQGSVLALVILTVFIIEMIDGAERAVVNFT